ncbi:MAG: hypothetical protein Q9216_003707 [Gyalolechia sp. 2 TL-2023]
MEDSDEDADSTELPEPETVIKSTPSASGMLPASSPANKRRRIDPSPALSKPFRSPFKTPLKKSSKPLQNTITPNSTSTRPSSSITKPTPVFTPTTISSRRKSPTRRLPTSGAIPSPSTSSRHLCQLQKQHTALLNELSSLRGNLDTATQALEIEASTTDAELEALIRKWRGVSRSAAEEVFEITKERVDGLGGVKAWRKREGEMQKGWGWEEEERKDNNTDGQDEGESTSKGETDGGFVDEVRQEKDGEDTDGEDEVRYGLYG